METNNQVKPTPFYSWRQYCLTNHQEAHDFLSECNTITADRWFVSRTVYDVWH